MSAHATARNESDTHIVIVSTSEFGIERQGRKAPIVRNLYYLERYGKKDARPPFICSFDVAGEGLTSFDEDKDKFNPEQIRETRWWNAYLGMLANRVAISRRDNCKLLILYGIFGGPVAQSEQKFLFSPEFMSALQNEAKKHHKPKDSHELGDDDSFRFELRLTRYEDFCWMMDKENRHSLGKHFCYHFKEYSFAAIVNAGIGVQLSVQAFEKKVRLLSAQKNDMAAERVSLGKKRLPQLYALAERLWELQSADEIDVQEISKTRQDLESLKGELEEHIRPPTFFDWLGSTFSHVKGFVKSPEPDPKRRKCSSGGTVDSRQHTEGLIEIGKGAADDEKEPEAPEPFEWTEAECDAQTLKANPSYVLAWNHFGNLGGGTVDGRHYTKAECYVQALQLDPKDADAWCVLGSEGGGTVAGKHYSEAECYVQALEADPTYMLGLERGGTVDGRHYTQMECYVRTLELDPQDAFAWSQLGFEGGGTVAGRHYTQVECYVRVLELDPKDAFAWYKLGTEGGGIVDGRHYAKAECYAQALTLDPVEAANWSELGYEGGGTVAGRHYTQVECYAQALTLNPKEAFYWYSLGSEGGGTVAGRHYTKAECYVQALEADPPEYLAWYSLGSEGGGTVAGRHYTKAECVQKYDELRGHCNESCPRAVTSAPYTPVIL